MKARPPAKGRETARQEIPAPLRRDVRMLGEVLGQVIADYGGAKLLRDVEQLRRTVIRARDDGRYERNVEKLVASWSLERADEVARAFTCYFHLVNLAEEHHRARVLRERDQGPKPLRESLQATVDELRSRHGARRLTQILADFEVHPVFTAHPTEARRRAVVTAIRRVGDQLGLLDDPRRSQGERMEATRRLIEEVDSLWRTGQLRKTTIQPLDEVRTVMSVFDETLFRVVPEIYRSLDWAMGPEDCGRRPPIAPAFLRFGSWVGGDRDGNPSVTADVTAATMLIQSEHILLALENATNRVGRSLTADAVTTAPSIELRRRLVALRAAEPGRLAELEKRSPSAQHRQYLTHVADRIRATHGGDSKRGYRSASELLDDLRCVQDSLAGAGALRLAYGELQHVIWQAETFGFHLAELEVRQHSEVHSRALAEVRSGGKLSSETRQVLDTLGVIASLQARFGTDACRRYVVSFTREVGDLADVYELAEHATGGVTPELDVVPLFETVADLRRAPAVMEAMVKLKPVQRAMRRQGRRRLEVMLGYSDSTKEVGPFSATLALYDAQASLTAWSAKNDLRLTLFHGRGGALGRGGGPANRAVRAQAPGSVGGHFKVTEQGEVIFARYGNQAIARRHLEQVASAVLEASAPPLRPASRRASQPFRRLALQVDAAARAAYRGLVEAEGFEEWFARVSPIEELSRLRIASRPQRRGGGCRLEDLRAIPWVFAWSQMRLNLPGWYGLGSGLAAADLEELRRAYVSWPLFNVLLDNAEMSLAKTDRRIAARYLALANQPELTERLLDEYDLTKERVLAVTGHSRLLEDRRVLSWAIELRNPYVDALSHLQLRALRALRAKGAGIKERSLAERLFLLTVNGVAAGLQNTG
ncbi:MAG TPA: phosphoenolpyruvate carboxylase [Candidatus Dormibacteraeota bacterium]|nr:phosphoenolpyruvate carboxylase [Candidatus Dormibacteraeota bacterium]